MVQGSDLGGADLYQLLKTTRPEDSQQQQRGAEPPPSCLEALPHRYAPSWASKGLWKLTFSVPILNRLGLFNLKLFIEGLCEASGADRGA